MPREVSSRKPTPRRYSDSEKAQAVRLVRELRTELGNDYGTVQRVANQLGYGVESVRAWVRRADVDDGTRPGVSSDEEARVKALEQEVKISQELRRANAILKSASAYVGDGGQGEGW